MRFSFWVSITHLLLALFCASMLGTAVSAAPYYTVQQVSDDYTLPKSTDAPFSVDPAKLPVISYYEGATYPTLEQAPIRVVDVNSQGTIIGAFPSSSSRAIPWSSLAYSYATLQADGSYGQLHFLGYSDLPGGQLSDFALNNRNEILLGDGYQQLVDANLNTYTNINDLVSPTDLTKYLMLSATGLGDDGSILATYRTTDFKLHQVLLIPPSSTSESPVPEPSTFAIFGVATIALALRQRRKSRRSQIR